MATVPARVGYYFVKAFDQAMGESRRAAVAFAGVDVFDEYMIVKEVNFSSVNIELLEEQDYLTISPAAVTFPVSPLPEELLPYVQENQEEIRPQDVPLPHTSTTVREGYNPHSLAATIVQGSDPVFISGYNVAVSKTAEIGKTDEVNQFDIIRSQAVDEILAKTLRITKVGEKRTQEVYRAIIFHDDTTATAGPTAAKNWWTKIENNTDLPCIMLYLSNSVIDYAGTKLLANDAASVGCQLMRGVEFDGTNYVSDDEAYVIMPGETKYIKYDPDTYDTKYYTTPEEQSTAGLTGLEDLPVATDWYPFTNGMLVAGGGSRDLTIDNASLPPIDDVISQTNRFNTLPQVEMVFKPIDIGQKQKVRIYVEIDSSVFDEGDRMGLWGPLETLGPIAEAGEVIDNSWKYEVFVRAADTKEELEEKEYTRIAIAEKEARYFQIKLVVNTLIRRASPLISGVRFVADILARLEDGKGLEVPVDGLDIKYKVPFLQTPTEVITIVDLQAGDYAVVTDETKDGFKVTVYDSTGTSVVRTVNFVAKGIGQSEPAPQRYRTSPARGSVVLEDDATLRNSWFWQPVGGYLKEFFATGDFLLRNIFDVPILVFLDADSGAQAGDFVYITAGSGFIVRRWANRETSLGAGPDTLDSADFSDLEIAQSVVRGRYEILAVLGDYVCVRVPDRYPAGWQRTTRSGIFYNVLAVFFEASNIVFEYYRQDE